MVDRDQNSGDASARIVVIWEGCLPCVLWDPCYYNRDPSGDTYFLSRLCAQGVTLKAVRIWDTGLLLSYKMDVCNTRPAFCVQHCFTSSCKSKKDRDMFWNELGATVSRLSNKMTTCMFR